MNSKDAYTIFKQKYHFQTQNLKFENIINTDTISCIREMVKEEKTFTYFKKEIDKGKNNLISKDSDIFFGLYTNADNCSYKIYLITDEHKLNEKKKELIMTGDLIKNTITYITPILMVCIRFCSIEVEVSENSFCLFSIIECVFRNIMVRRPHYIKNFVYEGGILGMGNDPKNENSDFPLFKTFGIYEKIDCMHKDNDYKDKYDLNFTMEDKKLIMTDFDIFEYYLNVKLKLK